MPKKLCETFAALLNLENAFKAMTFVGGLIILSSTKCNWDGQLLHFPSEVDDTALVWWRLWSLPTISRLTP